MGAQVTDAHAAWVRTWLRSPTVVRAGRHDAGPLMRRTPSLKKHPKGRWRRSGRLGCALDIVMEVRGVLYDRTASEREDTRATSDRASGSWRAVRVRLGLFAFRSGLSERARLLLRDRMRNKTSYEVVQQLASGPLYRDNIVWLGKHRADRRTSGAAVELLIAGLVSLPNQRLGSAPAGRRQIWRCTVSDGPSR